MLTRQTDIPLLLVGVIFIMAGGYVFTVDELVLYSTHRLDLERYRIGGFLKDVITFLLLLGGFCLIWTKGKW